MTEEFDIEQQVRALLDQVSDAEYRSHMAGFLLEHIILPVKEVCVVNLAGIEKVELLPRGQAQLKVVLALERMARGMATSASVERQQAGSLVDNAMQELDEMRESDV